MASSSSAGKLQETSDDVSLQDVTTSVTDCIPRGSAAHHLNTTRTEVTRRRSGAESLELVLLGVSSLISYLMLESPKLSSLHSQHEQHWIAHPNAVEQIKVWRHRSVSALQVRLHIRA
jgi:hypothetical protein